MPQINDDAIFEQALRIAEEEHAVLEKMQAAILAGDREAVWKLSVELCGLTVSAPKTQLGSQK